MNGKREMRKANMVLAVTMILLLIVHSAIGVLTLTGKTAGGQYVSKMVSHLFLSVISAHAVISVILTVKSLSSVKRSGAPYMKENRMFWIRRISGLAILPFAFQHFWMFSPSFTEEGMVAPGFSGLDLAVSILLAVCVIIHVASNIRPLSVSMGTGISRTLLLIAFALLAAGLVCLCWSFGYYFIHREALWAL